MNMETYFYKKEVDWSLLNQGFTIPLYLQGILYNVSDSILQHGEAKTIKLVLNGNIYSEKLLNLDFDRQKYPTHKEQAEKQSEQIGGLMDTVKNLQPSLRPSFGNVYTRKEQEIIMLVLETAAAASIAIRYHFDPILGVAGQ